MRAAAVIATRRHRHKHNTEHCFLLPKAMNDECPMPTHQKMVNITTGVHVENHPPGEIHELDDGKSLPRCRNDRGLTDTATATATARNDDDAALLAPTMNARPPTRLVDDGENVENLPPRRKSNIKSKSVRDALKQVAKIGSDCGRTDTATTSASFDDDAALLASTMNAHQPTMVNFATTNVDLEDGDDDIENHPPPRTRRKLTESEKDTIKHLVKDGLESSALPGNTGRIPYGWLPPKLAAVNSSSSGGERVDVKPYDFDNAKRKFQKNTKAKAKKEVIAEVAKRAIEVKQKNNGRLKNGFYQDEVRDINVTSEGKDLNITEAALQNYVSRIWNNENSTSDPVPFAVPSPVFPPAQALSTYLENAVIIQNSTKPVSKQIATSLRDNVGTPGLDRRHITDRHERRRSMKLQKLTRKRLSIANSQDLLRFTRLSSTPTHLRSSLDAPTFSSNTESTAFSPVLPYLNDSLVFNPTLLRSASDAPSFGSISESAAFYHLLSYLNEEDLVSVSLVSTSSFTDFAVGALGDLMLKSGGCSSSKDWKYLMNRFPWALYLGDGGYKRVYKVWNSNCGAYEAIAVMDVNEINESGNLNVVGMELAVSVMLSSLTKRGICPNFVLTRGVFTCQYVPPASLWGCREKHAPNGDVYDGRAYDHDNMPVSGDPGNYQYIRMELCDHGDVEGFIRNHPDKMLTPFDCRNLLFQMAFALHVAAERFSLKHYDVKLLNFFLQSATDSTIDIDDHPHVVLRYGVGSNIFRLRMHPSAAYIAKLGDYGTVVIGSDTDGKPISIGQFTTLENTPPDYLILGNAAEQGGGHDSFGLGLCLFHLFTGHCPYEEILDDVFCPDNLKGKLRTIWKQRSHNVIHSVMMDNNGMEDHTLYDTLYRFLVLFGIPEHQFLRKNHVWRAIDSTLNSRRLIKGSDREAFIRAREKYSLSDGTDKRIAGARRRLLELDGAMDLLLALVSFDPDTRAAPLDVINSRLMAELIEKDDVVYCEDDIVKSYIALAK